jgi:hypothetical protein
VRLEEEFDWLGHEKVSAARLPEYNQILLNEKGIK